MQAVEEIRKQQVNLVLIPNAVYNRLLEDLVKQLVDEKSIVCYVTANKTYAALKKAFDRKEINSKNFFFVDCITATVEKTQDTRDCSFVSSPSAINELNLAVTKALARKPDLMIFDSLSTLLIYQDTSKVTQFVHSIISRIRSTETTVVFTVLERDTDSKLVQDLGLFVDKILNLKLAYLKLKLDNM